LLEKAGLLFSPPTRLLLESVPTFKFSLPWLSSGNRFMTTSGSKGMMPALRNPAQTISGVQVFNQAFAKSSEKLYFVITLPGDDWMKLWHT